MSPSVGGRWINTKTVPTSGRGAECEFAQIASTREIAAGIGHNELMTPGKACELALRTILLPRDTNSAGSIFGGIILSHIDMAGVVPARKLAPKKQFVTVAMDKVVFHEPVFVGDLVSLYTTVLEVGRSSIKIQVDVTAIRGGDMSTGELQVTEAVVTYVAVDSDRKATPIMD